MINIAVILLLFKLPLVAFAKDGERLHEHEALTPQPVSQSNIYFDRGAMTRHGDALNKSPSSYPNGAKTDDRAISTTNINPNKIKQLAQESVPLSSTSERYYEGEYGVDAGHDGSARQVPPKHGARRQTRSVERENANTENAEALIAALKQHLEDPSYYNELVGIIQEIQQKLMKNHVSPNKDLVLKNILKSFMKRRFNSWGGKRSQQPSEFYSWGGRRKKATEFGAGLSQERGVRGFNAWGGKRGATEYFAGDRGVDHYNGVYSAGRERHGGVYGVESPGRLSDYSEVLDKDGDIEATRPDNTVFINLDLGETADKNADRQAGDSGQTMNYLHSYRYPGSTAEDPMFQTQMSERMIHQDMKRVAFNAWGGKRNRHELYASAQTSGEIDSELPSLMADPMNNKLKRKTFNQWGGK